MDSSIAMQIIKRLITCILILVFLLFGSNIAWLIVWCQYDYQTVEIEQDTEAENSDNLAIVDNEGDVSYGLPEDKGSDEEKE